MLVVRNDDRPGVIGTVGTMLGEAGVNIADMDVGRTPTPGSALMVLATTEAGRRPSRDRAARAGRPGILVRCTLPRRRASPPLSPRW